MLLISCHFGQNILYQYANQYIQEYLIFHLRSDSSLIQVISANSSQFWPRWGFWLVQKFAYLKPKKKKKNLKSKI